MKMAFVVQRYGKEVVGGAETYCRLLSEKLKDHFDVEILSSCAIDYMTWDNYYPPGIDDLNGVKIRRFAVEKNRDVEKFNDLQSNIITHDIQDISTQEEWMKMQGPYVPQLIEYIKQNEKSYDYLVFITYLYYQTYFGIRLFPEKSVLIPTAHDEPLIYFNIFKDIFNLPKGIIYLTTEEKEFVNKLFNNSKIANNVIGSGIEKIDNSDHKEFFMKSNIDFPYILYSGRIDASKGCAELFDFFLRYKFIFKNKLKLLLIGKKVLKIPEHRDIIFLGFLSEKDKYSAMSAAMANIIPSPYESNSITTLESFMCGRPVIVNEKCNVLKGHSLRSGAGLLYCDYKSFGKQLNFLNNNLNEACNMGTKGKEYVLSNYNWDTILEKYINFFNNLNMVKSQNSALTNRALENIAGYRYGGKPTNKDLQQNDSKNSIDAEFAKINEEWDTTVLNLGANEKGFKKLLAYFYRKILKILLGPFINRFLLKQTVFNSSAVRCLNHLKTNLDGISKQVDVISINIRNNNRLIADTHKQINNHSEWLELIRIKNEIQDDELKKLDGQIKENCKMAGSTKAPEGEKEK